MNWGFKNKTSFLRRIVLLLIGLLAFQTSAVGGSAGGFTGGYILSGGDLEFALESGWNGLKSGATVGSAVGVVSGYGYAKQQGINPWTGEVGGGKLRFPGTNPAKAPEGFEWRGESGSMPGSKGGNWYNPKTGESLRSDLTHPRPVGPHWDYKDPSGKWWRIFPDGSSIQKK